MLMHNAPLFRIYFGSASDSLFSEEYLGLKRIESLFELGPFTQVRQMMHLESLFFLNQVHADQGFRFTPVAGSKIFPFSKDGDFLVTQTRAAGIGVMTADCLPIIFYDAIHNAVGIAHAGWRGSARGVAVKTIEMMQREFGTNVQQVQIFFGPSAKICCYQVNKDFGDQLEAYSFTDQVLQKHGYAFFFDLPGFNRLQLEAHGIKKEAFHLGYNICTICDVKFCSYRRDGKKAARQMTVVSLK